MRSLFESVQFGPLVLRNRVFMAPLTRNRANGDGVPSEFAVQYYAQRASAGLIITEATQSPPWHSCSPRNQKRIPTTGSKPSDSSRPTIELILRAERLSPL